MKIVLTLFAALLAGIASAGELLILPPTLYAVEGRECNVYFNNLMKKDLSSEVVEVVCREGVHRNERWSFTPKSAGEVPLAIALRDPQSWSELDRAAAVVKVAPAAAGEEKTLNVLVIGDSLVESNLITGGLLELAAADPLALQLLGSHGMGENRHEGRSGWTVRNYTIGGVYAFTVKRGDAAKLKAGSTLTCGKSEFRLMRTVNAEGDASKLVCSLESGSAPEAETGVLSSGSGGKIAFSGVAAEHVNPFWRNGGLDIPATLAQNGFPSPDWVIIQLGTNDVMWQTDDQRERAALKGIFQSLDTLIASARLSGAKVGLMIIPPPAATQDAFGANYGSELGRARVKRNYLIWAEELIKRYQNREPEGIFLIPSNTAIDTANGFPRDPETGRQNNGVHPAPSGYRQLAEALWAFLKNQAAEKSEEK